MPAPRRPLPRPRLAHPLTLWLFLWMLCATPVLTDWLKDRSQVTLVDLALPLALAALTAGLAAFCLRREARRSSLSAYLAGGLACLLFANDWQDRLGQALPVFRALSPFPELGGYADLLFGAAFAALVLWGSLWLGRRVQQLSERRGWPAQDMAGGIALSMLAVFLLQAVPALRVVAAEWPQFFYRPASLPQSARVTGAGTPDIYYIVLDRYASQSVLQSQFGFDNAQFLGFLKDHGYATNPDSHNNYPYTAMSIASTLDADYHTDMVERFGGASRQTDEPYFDSIRYSPVIQRLKDAGYSYTELGSWYETTNQAPLADRYEQPEGQLYLFNRRITLNTFARNELSGSLFWQAAQHGLSVGNFKILSYSVISEQDATLLKLRQLKELASTAPGGRFIFAHLLIPHDPYFFNADGSTNPYTGNDNLGEPIKQKYLGQVQFINGQMEQVLGEIDANSGGKAVVILQSDEGPYPFQLNDQNFDADSVTEEIASGSMLDWSDADLRMKFGNLAAYRVPAASADQLAEGGDNVNIFRTVFNAYFGTDLPILPGCYYGYVNGREKPFDYTDITQRLTGAANPRCPVNSDFK